MSSNITLTIDGREIIAPEGEKILWVALENGIYIPHLCAIKEEERPSAACRLCFVEVEGFKKPVTACTTAVREGMVVKTRSERVDRLVKTAFELILTDHRLNCKECPRNRSCELQKIAKERRLKLRVKRLESFEKEIYIDDSLDLFDYDRSRCVLCGKCVWVCHHVAKIGAIGFSHRGMKRKVTTFGENKLIDSPCTQCGLCVEVCPVGALTFKEKKAEEVEKEKEAEKVKR